jgi:carbon storage regulator
MLVLSRKSNEAIVIGDNIKVMIVAIQGQCVRLGIDAPSSVPVNRSEVQQRIAYETAHSCQEKEQG